MGFSSQIEVAAAGLEEVFPLTPQFNQFQVPRAQCEVTRVIRHSAELKLACTIHDRASYPCGHTKGCGCT